MAALLPPALLLFAMLVLTAGLALLLPLLLAFPFAFESCQPFGWECDDGHVWKIKHETGN